MSSNKKQDFDCCIPNPADYNISPKFGFILPNPLKRLPDYFEPWNEIASNMQNLISQKLLRDKVKTLKLLDHKRLVTYHELRCAHLFLAMMAHGYVWQNGDNDVAEILPKQVAVPLCGVSDRLGVLPVISHVSYVLANWKITNPERPPSLENIEPITVFENGTSWFHLVTWQVEFSFVPAIEALVSSLKSISIADEKGLAENLTTISNVFLNMKTALARIHERLDAEVFYNKIRPFLAGWGGPSSPLPNGLIYEGVSTESKRVVGGSAAQSTTLQCIDEALQVNHESEREAFLESMRNMMPPEHVQFIEAIKKSYSIKSFVLQSENHALIQAYNQAIRKVVDFRSYHIQIATKYITIQAAKQVKRDYESVARKGTGGTSVLPFLKGLRDSTAASAIND